MKDGVYSHLGTYPLPEAGEGERPQSVPLRKLLFFWGGVCLAVMLAGMTISGFMKRGSRKRRKA